MSFAIFLDGPVPYGAVANIKLVSLAKLDLGPLQREITTIILSAGQLYLDREDFDEAKEYINKVLQLAPGQHDSYALLLKAVLNLKTGQFHVDKHTAKGGDARGRGDPKAAETLQKIHDCFFKALQHFNAVLRKDEHNIYAANGVAAVLAEKGNLMQAREIFTSVCFVSVLTIVDIHAGHAPVPVACCCATLHLTHLSQDGSTL